MGKIKITDVALRDAHQSLMATRMLTSDMLKIADKLDKVGYWSLETWGGATFDSCIRFLNEDPWERIRSLKKAMPNTKMQMLLRGQNILGYRNYADDVLIKFIETAAKNGVDVFRIFDALNDPRNLEVAIKTVKKTGKHAQAAISYAVTPLHTIDFYVDLAKHFKDIGADSICIKDMAGLLKPYTAYELIKKIKSSINIPINVHCHATTGLSVATLVKSIEAGADMVDTAISSLSMGTSHSPTETVVEMLKGTEYDTGLDMRLLDDISKYFRDAKEKYSDYASTFTGADTRILISQIPGGMLSNLENQLKEQNARDKLDEVLDEVALVQKDFGYPPLVTPTSQIVGTQAVFNVIFGKYKNLTGEAKNLLVGKYGKTPGNPSKDLVETALKDLNMKNAIDHRPADDIPNELEALTNKLKDELKVNTVTDEDVLTYALFGETALKFFKKRSEGPVSFNPEKVKEKSVSVPVADNVKKGTAEKYIVNVNGRDYHVSVRDEGTVIIDDQKSDSNSGLQSSSGGGNEGSFLKSPVAGTIFKLPFKDGDSVTTGDTVVILESMKMELEVKAPAAGKIKYFKAVGDSVSAQEEIALIN